MFRDLLHDVRYALRQLRNNPGFTLVAVLALGLGMGANTAIYSVVDALLIRSLPYPDAGRLVMVWEEASHVGFPHNTPAPANFLDWKAQNQVFTDMAAYRPSGANLTGEGNAEMLTGLRANWNLFGLLGVSPARGRTWTAEEERNDAGVVVLSYGLWQRRFGGDPGILGQKAQMDGRPHTIIGVMPAGFAFPNLDREFYQPLNLPPQAWQRRGSHFLQVLARLKPGITLARASADMSAIAQRLERTYPETNTKVGAVVVPLRTDLLGDTRPQLLVLLAATACVLLIACANVANLLLARSQARQRETAVRLALGAGYGRLLRQSLTESLVLAFCGALLGLALAAGSIRLLQQITPEGYAGGGQVALDLRVLGVTFAATILTGLLFGLAPALGGLRLGLHDTMRQGTRGASGWRRNGLRNGLVVAEVGLSLLLLVTAGLLLRTLVNLRGLDTGFRTDHLLVIRTPLSQPRYTDDRTRLAFMDEAVRRLERIPGVEKAAFVSTLPFQSIGNTNGFVLEGRPPLAPGNEQDSLMRVATTEYLPLLGVSLKEGRLFTAADRAGSLPVVVINEFFARTMWPRESPLGKRVRYGGDTTAPWYTIVGVIADVRERGFGRPMKFGTYGLQSQFSGWTASSLILRTGVAPTSVFAAVRQTMKELDPELPLARVRTMEEMIDLELAQRNRQMVLLGAFAGLALVLASIGLYGVLAYLVSQRTREIGIRMALGAQTSKVIQDVLRQGVGLTLAGIAAGTVAALALARVFQSLLFGISPSDPATYLFVAALLLMISLLASLIPARRAAAVDPAIVLREE